MPTDDNMDANETRAVVEHGYVLSGGGLRIETTPKLDWEAVGFTIITTCTSVPSIYSIPPLRI
jgi:hypothetical protein